MTSPRLKEKYDSDVVPKLKERFGFGNDHAVPTLRKIVVNMGVKGAVESKARVETAARELATVTGQKPTIRLSKKAISSFKLRQGMPIGCAPNVHVSLVLLPEEGRWFSDRRFPFQQLKLKALAKAVGFQFGRRVKAAKRRAVA